MATKIYNKHLAVENQQKKVIRLSARCLSQWASHFKFYLTLCFSIMSRATSSKCKWRNSFGRHNACVLRDTAMRQCEIDHSRHRHRHEAYPLPQTTFHFINSLPSNTQPATVPNPTPTPKLIRKHKMHLQLTSTHSNGFRATKQTRSLRKKERRRKV